MPTASKAFLRLKARSEAPKFCIIPIKSLPIKDHDATVCAPNLELSDPSQVLSNRRALMCITADVARTNRLLLLKVRDGVLRVTLLHLFERRLPSHASVMPQLGVLASNAECDPSSLHFAKLLQGNSPVHGWSRGIILIEKYGLRSLK
ncbi:uncharacterized protein LOC119181180 isoform X4 [Rhipicephalus microplus]|uniref:uncharacterized protein LOC119181180 isoform X4 n=1 Tax=Rhipicephalus microplus TaxID=6941 RepID=UPI003F6D61E6